MDSNFLPLSTIRIQYCIRKKTPVTKKKGECFVFPFYFNKKLQCALHFHLEWFLLVFFSFSEWKSGFQNGQTSGYRHNCTSARFSKYFTHLTISFSISITHYQIFCTMVVRWEMKVKIDEYFFLRLKNSINILSGRFFTRI